MSILSPPPPSLFFLSVLYHAPSILIDEILDEVEQRFSKDCGKFSIFCHPYCPMKSYYSKEMGEVNDLKRVFLFSLKPIDQTQLVNLKLQCCDLELKWKKTNGIGRNVNLDAGLVSLENVILATGKMFTHRIYLSQGIYADLTLMYKENSYQILPWSYPDYGHPEVIDFFNWYRKNLQIQRQ